MTMPDRMNCPHSGEGWCLDCVIKLSNQNADLKAILERICMWAEYPPEPLSSSHICGPESNCDDICVSWASFTGDLEKARLLLK